MPVRGGAPPTRGSREVSADHLEHAGLGATGAGEVHPDGRHQIPAGADVGHHERDRQRGRARCGGPGLDGRSGPADLAAREQHPDGGAPRHARDGGRDARRAGPEVTVRLQRAPDGGDPAVVVVLPYGSSWAPAGAASNTPTTAATTAIPMAIRPLVPTCRTFIVSSSVHAPCRSPPTGASVPSTPRSRHIGRSRRITPNRGARPEGVDGTRRTARGEAPGAIEGHRSLEASVARQVHRGPGGPHPR